jgi:hypothetical protein
MLPLPPASQAQFEEHLAETNFKWAVWSLQEMAPIPQASQKPAGFLKKIPRPLQPSGKHPDLPSKREGLNGQRGLVKENGIFFIHL